MSRVLVSRWTDRCVPHQLGGRDLRDRNRTGLEVAGWRHFGTELNLYRGGGVVAPRALSGTEPEDERFSRADANDHAA